MKWLSEFVWRAATTIVFLLGVMCIYAAGIITGERMLLEKMNEYGNIRIDGKIYIIEEVINNDK